MGTPAFMAPEQALARAGEVDHQTDQWAIGAIAYALLVGDIVHPAGSVRETLIFAATRPAPPLASSAPGVPVEVARVFDRALAFQKSDRWPTTSAMRDALIAAAEAAYGAVPDGSILHDAVSSLRRASR